jgi:hypothetical protein
MNLALLVFHHDFIDLVSDYCVFILWQDVGVDVRHGGAALRQLGTAASHCKLDPSVCFLMKQLCGQEIYRYPRELLSLLMKIQFCGWCFET